MSESKWISVEDRLPLVSQEVCIASSDFKSGITSGYLTDYTKKTWKAGYGLPVQKVTHWQYHPDPPIPKPEPESKYEECEVYNSEMVLCYERDGDRDRDFTLASSYTDFIGYRYPNSIIRSASVTYSNNKGSTYTTFCEDSEPIRPTHVVFKKTP